MISPLQNPRDAKPRFEYYPVDVPKLQSVPVDEFPFVIGRGEGVALQINSTSVSREHAEVVRTATGFRLRDLGSTNGTSINGQPVTESALADGDSVSIADVDLTFVCTSMGRLQRTMTRPLAGRKPVATPMGIPAELAATRGMSEALLLQAVPLEWYHLSDSRDGSTRATSVRVAEPLSNWMNQADSKDPAAVASRLEQLAWQLAAEQYDPSSIECPLLVQVAQRESLDDRLLAALEMAAECSTTPHQLGVVVHWEWATSTAETLRLCSQIRKHGFRIAYDDFSGGANCIDSMQEALPDYLIFSPQVIRGVSEQSRRLQRLEIVQESCLGNRIETALPAGTSDTDQQACTQVGIHVVEQPSDQLQGQPASLMANAG